MGQRPAHAHPGPARRRVERRVGASARRCASCSPSSCSPTSPSGGPANTGRAPQAPPLAAPPSPPRSRPSTCEIDSHCLTSVSLDLALGELVSPRRAAETGQGGHSRRLLLQPGHGPRLPRPGRGPRRRRRPGPRALGLAQRNGPGPVFRHNLLALRGRPPHRRARLPSGRSFTPPVKLYLLNGAEALFAYYTLARREAMITTSTWGVAPTPQASRSMLFHSAGRRTSDSVRGAVPPVVSTHCADRLELVLQRGAPPQARTRGIGPGRGGEVAQGRDSRSTSRERPRPPRALGLVVLWTESSSRPIPRARPPLDDCPGDKDTEQE
ncbi:hypothetical protein SGRIM128S_09665 [Streptomyces griseomycini]